MPTESLPGLKMDGARALIQHLRQNPGEASRPPSELATAFGLESRFVENVLAQIRPADRPAALSTPRFNPWTTVQEFGRRLHRLFLRMTENPILFLVISTILTGALLYAGIQFAAAFKSMKLPRTDRIVLLSGLGVATVIVFFGHLGCYFRHAKARYTLYGALIIWACLTLGFSIAIISDPTNESGMSKFVICFLMAFGMAMLAGLYAALGSVFSVLGGWYRMKKNEDHEEQMSRQELLQRYFELQSRLESGTEAASVQFWEKWPIVQSVRRNPLVWGLGFGAAGSLVQGITAQFFHINPVNPAIDQALVYYVILLILTLGQVCGYLVILFLAGSIWRSVLASLAYSVASAVVTYVPWFSRASLGLGSAGWVTLTYQTGAALGMAVFAGFVGVGATLQQQAARDQSLQKGDQATLMGEMLRIQWRLSNAAGVICVMVVDVVKSTLMKQGNDPLIVEYSFREYQDWITRVSAMYGGRVHSTAGDGAVVAFNSCEQAFSAAKRVQATIDDFNQTSNRLPTPFRVRIGLHTGQVEGDLDAVQFTSVIDVAAHIEETSESGGIAASDEVVAQLGKELFAPMARVVGGYQVFSAIQAS